MRYRLLAFGLLALAAQPTPGIAQDPVPGGATGTNVYCLQAGDLTSGAFVGAFLQTGQNAWEERLRGGVFRLEERKRDDLSVELFDATRSATIMFDFVGKTIKYKPANSPQPGGTDRYHMLNATDQASSEDCATVAAASGPEGSSPPASSRAAAVAAVRALAVAAAVRALALEAPPVARAVRAVRAAPVVAA